MGEYRMNTKPIGQYNKNIASLTDQLKQHYKTKNRISAFRLLVVIVTGVCADVAFHNIPWAGWGILLFGIAIFLYLLAQYVNNRNIIQSKEWLLKINKDET